MKVLIKYISSAIFAILLIINLNSCRKNFTIDELNTIRTDSLLLEGSFAGSFIESELSLIDFIPSTDSSFYIEIDETDLLHLRLYYEDYMIFTMNEIFPIVYPAPGGFPVLANSYQIVGDTSNLRINEKMSAGYIYFKDPVITFKIENEIPLTTFFRLDDLSVYDKDTIMIDNASHPDVVITAPTEPGTSVLTEVEMGTTEIPLLSDLFSPIPKFYSFTITAGSPADDVIPATYTEVTGEEKMYVDIDFDFPVDIRLDTLVMGDTANFNMESLGFYDQIEKAEIKIRFSNGFPLDAFSQIYFANTTEDGFVDEIVDSVFNDVTNQLVTIDGWNLESAETDSEGVVLSPKTSDAVIILDKERISNLLDNNVTKLVIQGKLNSYDNESGTFVKILSRYTIGVQIAVKADFLTSTNSF